MKQFKIIFIYNDDFLREDFFYSNIPEKRGWQVEHWSLLKLNKGNAAMPMKRKFYKKFGKRIYICDVKELNENIKRVSDDYCFFIFYPYHSYNKMIYEIIKKIKKQNFLFGNITEDVTVGVVNNYRVGSSLVDFITVFLRFMQIIYDILSFNRNKLRIDFVRFFGVIRYHADVNFVTSSAAYNFFPNVAEKWFGNNILMHSGVWEIYQNTSEIETKLLPNSYVVFIDQSLADLRYVDFDDDAEQYINDPRHYFSTLANLFNNIEKTFNVEVIVAAHPKSNYMGNEFGKRKVIKGKTPILVKNAKFVVIHFSTVFSNIIMGKKDFLCIYCDDLYKQKTLKSFYENVSKELHCMLLNIDRCDEVDNFRKYIKRYENSSYSACERKYILSNYKDDNNYQFTDFIVKQVGKIAAEKYNINI